MVIGVGIGKSKLLQMIDQYVGVIDRVRRIELIPSIGVNFKSEEISIRDLNLNSLPFTLHINRSSQMLELSPSAAG